MLVNIEHEDVSLGRIEGLEIASAVLLDAAQRAGLFSSEKPSQDRLADPFTTNAGCGKV